MTQESPVSEKLDRIRASDEAQQYIASCREFDDNIRLIILRRRGTLNLPLLIKAPPGQQARLEALWGGLKDSGGKMSKEEVEFIKLLSKGMVRRFESAMGDIQKEDNPEAPWKLTNIERDTCEQMAIYFLHMGFLHMVLGGIEEDFFQAYLDDVLPGEGS